MIRKFTPALGAILSSVLLPNTAIAQDLLPYPQSIEKLGAQSSLSQTAQLQLDPAFQDAAPAFKAFLSSQGSTARDASISEIAVKKDDSLSAEAYTLKLDASSLTISAVDTAGVYYALQTLQQLQDDSTKNFHQVDIADQPRFPWRGYMVDSSRHFWEIEQLKQFIDILSHYKMNRLHLHLTDNQGWRLEIKKYPKLSTVGALGNHTDRQAPAKFYTQEQMKELVAYAKSKHITIVPEIDMPGHAAAALRAYPEFSVGGKGGGTFNPSNPATLGFLKDILKETSEVFDTPYIHFGADEVGKGNWEKDPFISKQMKELGVSKAIEIEHHFVKVITEYIEMLGRTPIGWDEINEGHSASKNSIIMCWRGNGAKHAKKAVSEGRRVIMSPQDPVYFDWSYGNNSTSKVYNWDPTFFTADKQDLVYGVQANLWTEQVPNIEKFYGMTFPRGLALAESAWTNQEHKDWERFYPIFKKHLAQFDAAGISYYDEQGQNERDFDPKKDKPTLNRPVKMSTSLPAAYNLHFAFDGRKKSYFWSARGPRKDDHITVSLNEPADANEVNVWTGDLGKDSLRSGILEVSYDGDSYEKVADFVDGNASHKFDKPTTIKGVRITATAKQGAWLTVKEIEIK